ncbi:putative quinol monooxygenase [Hirschia baltica]|uniref:Antibiotic biosynthesis monooxygenase n=1 Tax=Hirschia baltica (strain ATCC 49814 / DSM 5838 / IFAM 1418) TaxID=582402 RepID=C6XMR9_HIRBI|nr:putative quinol monooxygenase [Hirschia baltica]ACT59983.1 Antibiotic biosynthesis monooxygenase [Hirschia baltica ATCC 49814]
MSQKVIIVTGTFRLPIENREAARNAMQTMVEKSRAEAGCILYSYAFDFLDENLVHFIEKWDSREALQAHFAIKHMAEWRSTWPDLGVADRNANLYEAVEESF